MPPSSGELYDFRCMPQQITVDCLLPTGIILPLGCIREATLAQVKADLFQEARHYPLYSLLKGPECYSFVSVLQSSDLIEFVDESRRLCDLHLFKPLLKLAEASENTEEKKTEAAIHQAVGGCVHDFATDEDDEVVHFRKQIMLVCDEVVNRRDGASMDDKLSYIYPPDLEADGDLHTNLRSRLKPDGSFVVKMWMMSPCGTGNPGEPGTLPGNPAGPPAPYTTPTTAAPGADSTVWGLVTVFADTPADALPHVAVSQMANVLRPATAANESFIVKVCGIKQYIVGPHQIIEFKYISDCLAKGHIPELLLVPKSRVYEEIPPSGFRLPAYARRKTAADLTTRQMLYQINDNFKVKVMSAYYLNVTNVDKVFVRAGLYHGTELLCAEQESKKVDHSCPEWKETLKFNLFVPDIPRSARLCISVCAVLKKSRDSVQIAWGNVPLFDFKNVLVSGKMKLALWPVPKGLTDLLNPLGTVSRNRKAESAGLMIEFDKYSPNVRYPTFDEVCSTGQRYLDQKESENPGQEEVNLLFELIKRDPLYEITEQDKQLLWTYRYFLRKVMPDALPKLLDAVEWNQRNQVSEMYRLLRDWPLVSPEIALELLDCKYPDQFVRDQAVNWLHLKLPNKLLAQYLLQLVQVLKYEPYLDNPLGKFLLRRALLNYSIGHNFFWHLKAEMHDMSVAFKFGLLLEAFCRGMGTHLKAVVKQVGALDKLTQLTDALKTDSCRDKKAYLDKQLAQPDYLEALQNFPSPLNNSLLLGSLETSKCRVMSSAKKPLWLIWNNPEFVGDSLIKTHQLIFKNGDDLRQDMLTLQVIKIMDSIWKQDGLDMQMMPYACLSTGENVGLIEVVKDALTVMDIQRMSRLSKFQFDSTRLHRWIREKNEDESRYLQAVETFTHSCAGYCVATFILGIGDRNPDNIMVNEEGHIFHIDFGHFLGHFKKKFGINRERVPFVLTEDFICVIARGEDQPHKSKHFLKFQELCYRAYTILHKHSRLLITLFTMMLSTGIPELQSIDDISYLRNTLQVDKNEHEALHYFQTQLSDAYGGAWCTKLDWFFHSVKHM